MHDPDTGAGAPSNLPGLPEILSGLPRVEADVWNRLDPVRRWLIAARAPVLALTLWSVLFVGLLGALRGEFSWLPWLGCLVGLTLAHACNNLLNDLTDSVRGVDQGNYFRTLYGVHVLEQQLLTRVQLLMWASWTGLAALAIGLGLVWLTGPQLLLPLGLGGVLLVTYTWPLKQLALGEIAVLAVWGPLMMGGTWVAMTGHWDASIVAISVLHALGPGGVIFGKHLDKLDQDAAKGIGTLPVRLGESATRSVMRGLLGLQYVGLAVLMMSGVLPLTCVLAFLALPTAWAFDRRLREPRPVDAPAGAAGTGWPLWFAASGFVHARRHGGLLILGLLVAIVLRWIDF